jgi:hypothetical protein
MLASGIIKRCSHLCSVRLDFRRQALAASPSQKPHNKLAASKLAAHRDCRLDGNARR